DLLHALLGGAPADLGVGAGAQALGQRVAELDLVRRHVGFQRLHVGVRDHELDPVQVAADHGVDRVAAPATEADDEDLRVTDVVEFDECHGVCFPLVGPYERGLLARATFCECRRTIPPASACARLEHLREPAPCALEHAGPVVAARGYLDALAL